MGYLIVFAVCTVAAWFAASRKVFDALCEAAPESEPSAASELSE